MLRQDMAKWKKLSHTIYQCKYQHRLVSKVPIQDTKGCTIQICRANPEDAM